MKRLRLKNEAIGEYHIKYAEGDLPIANIWLTGRCNLGCVYCATKGGKADKGELSPKEWEKVILQCKELGADTVSINGKGEPLLDKGFNHVISCVNGNSMRTILSTNGTNIGKRMAKFLYNNMVDIVLKMPSFDPKVYNRLAETKGAFGRAWRGLENLMIAGYPAASENPDEILTRLSLEVLLVEPALDAIPEIFRYCKEHQIYPMVDGIVAAGRVLKNRNLEELELSEKEEARLYKEFEEIFGYQYEGEPNYNCPIRMGIFIDNQGFVRADWRGNSCDVPYKHNVGNVRDAPVAELWNRLKKLRERAGNRLEYAEPEECTKFPRCYRMLETREEYFQNI